MSISTSRLHWRQKKSHYGRIAKENKSIFERNQTHVYFSLVARDFCCRTGNAIQNPPPPAVNFFSARGKFKPPRALVELLNYSHDELREERGALSNDSGCSRLLLLRTAEVQPVVHLALLVQHGLLLLHLAHALLLRLVRLRGGWRKVVAHVNTMPWFFNSKIGRVFPSPQRAV